MAFIKIPKILTLMLLAGLCLFMMVFFAGDGNFRDPVLVGAGDIAICKRADSAITAKMIESMPGTVFIAGDASNDEGKADQYRDCFSPTWGQLLGRIRAAVGNHDYDTKNAAPYYAYFGAAAGPVGKGYYSYDLRTWHIIVLNSECKYVGGCQKNSPEEQWLRADLAAHPNKCTLAIWHRPRFCSGEEGEDDEVSDFWEDLYEAGTELVLNGHNHLYERFAPQDPDGNFDPQKGIREFVVGTGGATLERFQDLPAANSEVRIAKSFGVLKLTLYKNSYNWHFYQQPGKKQTDTGGADCH
jgi:hypothetical protein